MIDENSDSQFESLLVPRLLNGTPLANTLEKDKWRIIAETIDAMRKLFFRINLNRFDSSAAEMYDKDLGLMMEAIDDSPKYEGYIQVLRYLGESRSEVSNVAQYYGKGPNEHKAATRAMMKLQETLKKALEYIIPICKKL